MSAFEILFHVGTNWPKGRKKKPDEKVLTGMEWKQTATLPFVPRKGDMVCLGEDDFRRVDDVYIIVKREPGLPELTKLEVHFEFSDFPFTYAQMTGMGWAEA